MTMPNTTEARITDDHLYTVQEASGYLRTSVYTVREMLKSGNLKGFKVGTKWRILESSLKALQESKGEDDDD